MYSGSGVAVAALDEKLCLCTLAKAAIRIYLLAFSPFATVASYNTLKY